MPATTRINRKDFLKEYKFPVEPSHDFERIGVPARYASGHPKELAQALDILDFGADDTNEGGRAYRSYQTALSPDTKLLAVSTRAGRILIYDISSKELRQVLDGAGHLVFRPTTDDARDATKRVNVEGKPYGLPAYTVISSLSDAASRGGLELDQLMLWDLDRHGRVLNDKEPINSADIATKAIDAITSELSMAHCWTKEFIQTSDLHTLFEKALSRVDTSHRRRHNTLLNNASLGGFESSSFSHSGRYLLYHSKNASTQQEMRESSELPQVVVYDLDGNKELHRLSGHTDAIMWSAISPDDKHVASVSWDGTLRLYAVSTGALEWATEDSGGQSWSGAFSPDSKHIVWSCANGVKIQVHDVDDGRQLSVFQGTISHWCRCLKWHPTRKEVALCADRHAYVWNVFDGLNGSVLQDFALPTDDRWRSLLEVSAVDWMDEGKKLYICTTDGTKLVYDVETNTKELFKHAKGETHVWVNHGFYGIIRLGADKQFYLSIDRDGKARYWSPSTAAHPS